MVWSHHDPWSGSLTNSQKVGRWSWPPYSKCPSSKWRRLVCNCNCTYHRWPERTSDCGGVADAVAHLNLPLRASDRLQLCGMFEYTSGICPSFKPGLNKVATLCPQLQLQLSSVAWISDCAWVVDAVAHLKNMLIEASDCVAYLNILLENIQTKI